MSSIKHRHLHPETAFLSMWEMVFQKMELFERYSVIPSRHSNLFMDGTNFRYKIEARLLDSMLVVDDVNRKETEKLTKELTTKFLSSNSFSPKDAIVNDQTYTSLRAIIEKDDTYEFNNYMGYNYFVIGYCYQKNPFIENELLFLTHCYEGAQDFLAISNRTKNWALASGRGSEAIRWHNEFKTDRYIDLIRSRIEPRLRTKENLMRRPIVIAINAIVTTGG